MTIALLPLEAPLTGAGNTQPITAALLGIATVGILTALGAMVGKILADSGGSDAIVETLVGRSGTRMLVDAGRFGDRGLGQRVGHLPDAPGLVAVGVRLATGSTTVATITARRRPSAPGR